MNGNDEEMVFELRNLRCFVSVLCEGDESAGQNKIAKNHNRPAQLHTMQRMFTSSTCGFRLFFLFSPLLCLPLFYDVCLRRLHNHMLRAGEENERANELLNGVEYETFERVERFVNRSST